MVSIATVLRAYSYIYRNGGRHAPKYPERIPIEQKRRTAITSLLGEAARKQHLVKERVDGLMFLSRRATVGECEDKKTRKETA